MKDFSFTGDDYSYKIEIEAKRRFLQLLKERFNSCVKYKGKAWNWDTVIQLKTQELARFLLGECEWLSFEPRPVLVRADNLDVRNIIQKLSTREAQKLGIGKSTLHYLRKNAKNSGPFKIYQEVRVHLCDMPSHVP